MRIGLTVVMLLALGLSSVAPVQAQNGPDVPIERVAEIWDTYQQITASEGGEAAYAYLGTITLEEQVAFTEVMSQVVVVTEDSAMGELTEGALAAGCYTISGSILYESVLGDNLFRFYENVYFCYDGRYVTSASCTSYVNAYSGYVFDYWVNYCTLTTGGVWSTAAVYYSSAVMTFSAPWGTIQQHQPWVQDTVAGSGGSYYYSG